MRHTIRHDATGRSIVAYLSATDEARRAGQIVAYMDLMHAIPDDCVRAALKYLADSGTIERLRRGWYRRRWELAS